MCHDIQKRCVVSKSGYDYIWNLENVNDNPIYRTEKKTQIYRINFLTLWDNVRVGCFQGTALKTVYYLGWNRSPAQVGCMRQVLGTVALGKPRGNGWRGRWDAGLEWGKHVNPWLFHFNVWQNPPQIKKKKRVDVMSYKVPRLSYMQWVWFHSYIGCDVIIMWVWLHRYIGYHVRYIRFVVIHSSCEMSYTLSLMSQT